MESPNPKFALKCSTNQCDRTNMPRIPLSEVSTGAVSLTLSKTECVYMAYIFSNLNWHMLKLT